MFIGFLERVDQAVPAKLDVHILVDNYMAPTSTQRLGSGWPHGLASTSTHPDLLLVAQPGRELVRAQHLAGHPAKQLQKRQGSQRQDQPLHPALQPQIQTLGLDATADSILKKLIQLCKRISGT